MKEERSGLLKEMIAYKMENRKVEKPPLDNKVTEYVKQQSLVNLESS